MSHRDSMPTYLGGRQNVPAHVPPLPSFWQVSNRQLPLPAIVRGAAPSPNPDSALTRGGSCPVSPCSWWASLRRPFFLGRPFFWVELFWVDHARHPARRRAGVAGGDRILAGAGRAGIARGVTCGPRVAATRPRTSGSSAGTEPWPCPTAASRLPAARCLASSSCSPGGSEAGGSIATVLLRSPRTGPHRHRRTRPDRRTEAPADPTDPATAAYRARIRTCYAERTRTETALAALTAAIPAENDPGLLDQLPIAAAGDQVGTGRTLDHRLYRYRH